MKKQLSILFTAGILFSVFCVAFLPVKAEYQTPILSVQSVYARPGECVEVEVNIQNNTNILGAAILFTFDSGLTLKEYKAGDAFAQLYMTPPGELRSPCRFVWDGLQPDPESVRDGVVLTLTFEVAENMTPRKLHIVPSCQTGDMVDGNMNVLSPELVGGTVEILNYTPGDVDVDGAVTVRDIIVFRRYLAGGYGVTINKTAGDINADGAANLSDILLLRRYIADGNRYNPNGYAVKLLPGKTGEEHIHTLVAVAAKAASCTEAGTLGYWKCSDCGKYFRDSAGTMETTPEAMIIPALGHNEENGVCTRCGAGGAAIVVSNTAAAAGAEEAAVRITLKNNPGITCASMELAFDSSVLTFKRVEYGSAFAHKGTVIDPTRNGMLAPETIKSPIYLLWTSGLENLYDEEADFATVYFSVSPNANAGTYPLTVSYREDDICDISEKNVYFSTVNGSISIP